MSRRCVTTNAPNANYDQVAESVLDGRCWLPSGLGTGAADDGVGVAWLPHDTHGHGPPNFFSSTERNLSAGPSFMFSECIKWSSVSSGSPAPSMHCSRKFCVCGNRAEKWKK